MTITIAFAYLCYPLQGAINVYSPDCPLLSVRRASGGGERARGQLFALLIGINAYQHVPKLQYAVHDVSELREVLVNRYHFPAENVTVLTDAQATLENIRRALAQMVNNTRVKPDDQLLIYFSGHGQTVPTEVGGDKGFLIPVDAEVELDNLQNPGPYLTSCLPMDDIWTTLDLCPARHVLLIADACYSGLLAHPRELAIAVPASPAGDMLRELRVRPARQVMTAGGKGETALEDPALGHGLFTAKLLDELKARATKAGNVFTTVQLYVAIKTPVIDGTGGKQIPQLADRNTEGEFLFTVPGSASAGDNAVVQPGPPVMKDTAAQLRLTTDPPGATVLLDGALQAEKTPCTLTVEMGATGTKTVEIGLTLEGYHDELREATLERGKLTPVPVTLSKKAEPLQRSTTSAAPIATKINAKDGAEMVWIPPGEFSMGSRDGHADEKPVHQINLEGFWMYKNDVTVAQYRQFCTATGRAMPEAPEWGWQDDHPIVNVSWDDAAAYAHRAGAALPTEAEWEKAARGTDGRTYPWGNAWDAEAAMGQFGKGETAPVGSYPAGVSPYGCLDMAGNVWQWCADWYGKDYYTNSPSDNPTGPASGTMRVLRGGAWYIALSAFFRTSNRYQYLPAYRFDNCGFRCALHAPAPETKTSEAIATKVNPADGAPMTWVPAGEFIMGCNEYDDERPAHPVYLDGFWMYKTNVTVAAYRKFCTAMGREMPRAPAWGWQDDFPMVDVSWDDAKAYADWAGVALPTEAEWEKAARGTDGRQYPWGNEWDAAKCGSGAKNARAKQPAAVGSFPSGAGPYGCLDLLGSVAQWCADWYDENYYDNSPSRNPPGAETGTARVMRGGCFYDIGVTGDAALLRASKRSSNDPAACGNAIGFRCVARTAGP